MKLSYYSWILLYFSFLATGVAQYSIQGQLFDSENRYNQILLQFNPSAKELSGLNMNNLVNSAPIDSNGYFLLEGNDLPDTKSFYQLILSTGENGYGIFNGQSKNYIFIALENTTHLEISNCQDITETFAGCTITGNTESDLLQQLVDNILPTVETNSSEKAPVNSELKEQFQYRQHTDVLMQYMDTSQFLLPALVAYHSLRDAESEIRVDPEFFSGFLSKIERLDSKSRYFLEAKVEIQSLLEFENGTAKSKPWFFYLSAILIPLSLLLMYLLYRSKQEITALKTNQQKTSSLQELLPNLSSKELEVFELIVTRKSNKEIASSLFISLSTVKSHITNIYQKVEVSSRKELLQKWNSKSS